MLSKSLISVEKGIEPRQHWLLKYHPVLSAFALQIGVFSNVVRWKTHSLWKNNVTGLELYKVFLIVPF